MHASKFAFEGWLYQVCNGEIPSLSVLSQASGLSKAAISVQRTKNAIHPSTIMKLSRGYGLHPLQELARFDGYQGLWPVPEIHRHLLLTLVPPVELIKELLRRSGHIEDPAPKNLRSSQDALIRWADRIGPTLERKVAAEGIGVRAENLSRNLNIRRLSLDHIIAYAKIAGSHPALGICAAGWLDPEELPGVACLTNELQLCTKPQIGDELEASKRYVRATFELIIADTDMREESACTC